MIRNGLAQVARKCVKNVTDGVEKATGKMIDSVEKVAKKIETKN